MATTDTAVINLLVKQQGAISGLAAIKNLGAQTKAAITLTDNWATHFGVSVSQILRSIETYNTTAKTLNRIEFPTPAITAVQNNEGERQAKAAQVSAATKELEENKNLIANKTQQINTEKQLVTLKEREAQLAEEIFQNALKPLPQDKTNQKMAEAESIAMLTAEKAKQAELDKNSVANQQQKILLEKELSKHLVLDVETARTMAEAQDAQINKSKQLLANVKLREEEEKKVLHAVELLGPKMKAISAMTPHGQTQALSKEIMNISKTTGVATSSLLKMAQSLYNLDPTTVKNISNEMHFLKNGVVDTAKELINVKSIINTAFGTFTAMLLFQLQMAVSQFITDTIQQARDLQNALGKISIAETVMSKSGIEVSGKELLGIVAELKKEFTNISNIDMLKVTGATALELADAGITPKELRQLLQAGLSAQIRNPEKTIDDVMGTINNSVLSGNVRGVQALGILISETEVQNYAKKVGLIEEAGDKLTKEQKVHATIGLINEKSMNSMKETLKLQDNLANAGSKFTAAWKDFTSILTPLVDGWNAIVYIISIALLGITDMVRTFSGAKEATTGFQKALKAGYDIIMGIVNMLPQVKLLAILWQGILTAYEKVSGKKISEQPSIANLEKQDTPTAPIISDGTVEGTEDNADKIAAAMRDLAEAMDAFGDRARKMEEDFANSMEKMREDFYDFDLPRFLEDWDNARQNIIDDSNKKIEDIDRKHRDKELEDERKFQEELRQLKEKFMMSLEDALHERDARQVLRLTREYAMNKRNMINEHNLKREQDDRDTSRSKEDIIRDRDERLKLLDQENALKQKRMEEDYALKKKRAEEEHKLEMRRLEEEKDDKLRQMANSLGETLKLNKEGLEKLRQVFDDYFGDSGALGGLVKYQYDNIVIYTDAMLERINEVLRRYAAAAKAFGGITPAPKKGDKWWEDEATPIDGGNRAFGGLDIANSPTRVTMGEAGPEAHLFVPLNRLSTLAGGANGLGNFLSPNGGGKMEVLVELSKDLEARIIRKSMDNVSGAIANVRRKQ